MQYHQVIWRVASMAALIIALSAPALALDILKGEDVIQQIADNITTGGEVVVLEGPEDENGVETYSLSETLVVTQDISPLTIEGARTSSGTSPDNILPNQIVLEGADGPVIEVEEGAVLILRNLAVSGGTIGVSALKDATVTMERCYINGTGAEGLYFTENRETTVKSTAIVGCGGDGVYIDSGSVTIFQCTILDNGGAGVNAAAGTPEVYANIVYNNVVGLRGGGMDAQNNWVFKNRCAGGEVTTGSFPLESEQVVADPRADTGAGCGSYWLDGDELTIEIEHNLPDAVDATLMIGAAGAEGVPLDTFSSADSIACGTFTLDSAGRDAFDAGDLYVIITSAAWPAGHIRGQITEGAQCVTERIDFPLDAEQVVSALSASTSIACGSLLRLHDEVTISIDHDVADPVAVTVGVAAAGSPEAPLPLWTFDDATAIPLSQTFALSATSEQDLADGNLYVLMTSAAQPLGDVRGQIEAGATACAATVWDFPLDAPQVIEQPSTSSSTGCGHLFLSGTDEATLTISHDVTDPQLVEIRQALSGATGPVIRTFAVPTATPLREHFTLTPAEVTALNAGELYIRITSAAFPTGDIRGQIEDSTCPSAGDGGGGCGGGGGGGTSDPDCDYDVGNPGEVTPVNPVAPDTAEIDANGDDPEDFFVSGVWRGDLALIKRANDTVGGTSVDLDPHPDVVNDFENELRVAGTNLEVGADEFNGVAAAGLWTVCRITSTGRDITVYVEVEGLSLVDAEIFVEPQGKGVDIITGVPDVDYLVVPVTPVSNVSPRFGRADFTVPGEIGTSGLSWDGEALVYLRIVGTGAGIYGGPNGDFTTDPPVWPTLADRTFIVDSLPPVLVEQGTGRAHEYITSSDGLIAPASPDYPTGWDPAIRVVPSSGGTFHNEFRDPQAFFNVQTGTMDFTVSVLIEDPRPPSGAVASGFLDSVALATTGLASRTAPAEMTVSDLLYEDNLDVPGTVWLGYDGENTREFNAIANAGSASVTFNLAQGLTSESILATWIFTGVPYVPGWHVVLRIKAMDLAGNRMEAVRPLHLWWMQEAVGELTSEPSGEVSDPAFGWRLANRSDEPDDPAPASPIARFALFRLEADNSLTPAFTPNGWSVWTYDRTITRATYVGDVGGLADQTLGQVIDRFANPGDTLRLFLVAADEAGNVQDPGVVSPDWAEWVHAGDVRTVDTDVRARFWHNVTHERSGSDPATCVEVDPVFIARIDLGRERDFGGSTEIPLPPENPGQFSKRVEAGITISVNAPGIGGNFLSGAVWNLSEDGRLVARGAMMDLDNSGEMYLQVPEDLLSYYGQGHVANPELVALTGPNGTVLNGADIDLNPVQPLPNALDFLNARSVTVECGCNGGYTPDRLGDDGHFEQEVNCEGDAEAPHRRRRVTYELTVWGMALNADYTTAARDESPSTIRFVVYPPGQGGGNEQGVKEFTRE